MDSGRATDFREQPSFDDRVGATGGKVGLIFMPWGTTLQPSLAFGQFQGQLEEAGIESETYFFNFKLAAMMGFGEYEIIGRMRGNDTQIGEWLFAKQAWLSTSSLGEREFLEKGRKEVLSMGGSEDENIEALLRYRHEVIPAFLDECADIIVQDSQLAAIAFTCMFFQTVPTVALARRIKERRPDLPILLGGACFHGEMGRGWAKHLPWVDAISVGEADDIIVPLVRSAMNGRNYSGLHGILYRDETGKLLEGPPSQPVTEEVLEGLPVPQYSDYFAEINKHGLNDDRHFMDRVFVPFENSRGCWWGQVKHCTFCGLNSLGMSYRAKSPGRAVDIVRQVRQRYGTPNIYAADNILPQHYYQEFLPVLAKEGLGQDLRMYYEIKSNIGREQARALRDGGVRYIIPGIESLSTNVLKSIDKGVSCIRNVQALKLFAEFGLIPGWSLLMRVPGERPEDYREMAALIPLLEHLHPPFGGPRKIEMHRFSPYFDKIGQFAERVRPQNWYHGIYPEDEIDINSIAYYFDADWKNVASDVDYEPVIAATWKWVDVWREQDELPNLTLHDELNGGLLLRDTRMGRNRTWILDPTEAAIYRAMDVITPAQRLQDAVSSEVGGNSAANIINEFCDAGIAIMEDGACLALALPAGAPRPSLAERRSVLKRVGQDAERKIHKSGEARQALPNEG